MAEVVVIFRDPEGEKERYSNAWAEEEGHDLVIYGRRGGQDKRLARFAKDSLKSWYTNEREG
jgi:hypothetical protein